MTTPWILLQNGRRTEDPAVWSPSGARIIGHQTRRWIAEYRAREHANSAVTAGETVVAVATQLSLLEIA